MSSSGSSSILQSSSTRGWLHGIGMKGEREKWEETVVDTSLGAGRESCVVLMLVPPGASLGRSSDQSKAMSGVPSANSCFHSSERQDRDKFILPTTLL